MKYFKFNLYVSESFPRPVKLSYAQTFIFKFLFFMSELYAEESFFSMTAFD